MLRYTSRRAAAAGRETARSAVAGATDHYDHIILGGGVAGCVLAAKLSAGNQRTLLVERGSDVRKNPSHYTIPAAPMWHRMSGQRHTAVVAETDVTWRGASQHVSMRVPSVLGGAGVALGGRTWYRGHRDDWGKQETSSLPLKFDEDMLTLYKRLENIEGTALHRGLHGKFALTKPIQFSPLHLPFVQGLTDAGYPLIAQFNPAGCLATQGGSGRPEVMVDANTGKAFSSLSEYLLQAIMLRKPINIMCGTEATKLTFAKPLSRSSSTAASVATIQLTSRATGATTEVCGNNIVLCCGAVGTPRLLLGSEGLPQQLRDSLSQALLWTQPAIALQYRCKTNETLAPAASSVVRSLAYLEWRFFKRGWCISALDDMTLLMCSVKDGSYPNVRADFMPVCLNADGSVDPKDGFQVVVRLLRPTSRGTAADPAGAVLRTEEDVRALEDAIAAIKACIEKSMAPRLCDPEPFAEIVVTEGAVGGTCPLGIAVDPQSMLLRGTENVFVADGSLVPSPVTADLPPLAMVLAERTVDRMAVKKSQLGAAASPTIPSSAGVSSTAAIATS